MTFTRKQKRILSRVLNQGKADLGELMESSLLENSRWAWDESCEHSIEYGFIDPEEAFEEWFTDSEIDLWFEQMMARKIPSYMYWDCTGVLFTVDIRWHRNPCGLVSFVHRLAFDI